MKFIGIALFVLLAMGSTLLATTATAAERNTMGVEQSADFWRWLGWMFDVESGEEDDEEDSDLPPCDVCANVEYDFTPNH